MFPISEKPDPVRRKDVLLTIFSGDVQRSKTSPSNFSPALSAPLLWIHTSHVLVRCAIRGRAATISFPIQAVPVIDSLPKAPVYLLRSTFLLSGGFRSSNRFRQSCALWYLRFDLRYALAQPCCGVVPTLSCRRPYRDTFESHLRNKSWRSRRT